MFNGSTAAITHYAICSRTFLTIIRLTKSWTFWYSIFILIDHIIAIIRLGCYQRFYMTIHCK